MSYHDPCVPATAGHVQFVVRTTRSAIDVLLLPDHFTPISIKTHSEEPVPFALYRSRATEKKNSRKNRAYSENICRMKNILVFEKGYKLMDYFINGK